MNSELSSDQAIKHYLKVLRMDNWAQEKYVSCIELGKLFENSGNKSEALVHYFNSVKYDAQRIEGVVLGCQILAKQGNHVLVNAIYHKYKDYSLPLHNNSLFLNAQLYDDSLEYLNSVSAFFANDVKSGFQCAQLVLKRRKASL